MIVFLLIGVASIVGVALLLIGLTRHDLRSIQLARQYRAHPHARKWRQRPRISVYISDTSSLAITKSLQKIYKNHEIITLQDTPTSDFILTLRTSTVPTRETLLLALRQYFIDPTISVLELAPPIPRPKTLAQLLGAYRLLLASICMKARLGFRIRPRRSLFPTLARRAAAPQSRSDVFVYWGYHVCDSIIAICLPVLVTYAVILAATTHTTEPLSICLVGFYAILMTAIWSYEGMSFVRKLGYSLLSPITLGYFFVLCWLRPLKMLTDMAKAKVPFSIGLFVRVKDILRIV